LVGAWGTVLVCAEAGEVTSGARWFLGRQRLLVFVRRLLWCGGQAVQVGFLAIRGASDEAGFVHANED
jgi:hypothetical protein